LGLGFFWQVAALVPKAELEGDMGDAQMALQARLMSKALRRLTHSLNSSQCLLIFINQVLNEFGAFCEWHLCKKVLVQHALIL
jgi:RecA/RadA recombinase